MSPAGPGYAGGATSPNGGGSQAAAEPFAADSPYFPFSTRTAGPPPTATTRHTPTKQPRGTAGALHQAGPGGPLRPNSVTKDEHNTVATIVDNQHWVVSTTLQFKNTRQPFRLPQYIETVYLLPSPISVFFLTYGNIFIQRHHTLMIYDFLFIDFPTHDFFLFFFFNFKYLHIIS